MIGPLFRLKRTFDDLSDKEHEMVMDLALGEEHSKSLSKRGAKCDEQDYDEGGR